jgi:cytochrome d ubiquinol oxidase subunit II
VSTFWFLVLGALFATYFALAGIDYGVGLLLPTMRGDTERRRALNAIGPMFLGNEVWIVGAAGVLIAAFPRIEGELFGATYPVLVAVLLGLVAINAGVQLRSRGRRRRGFDLLIAVSSATLAVGWGMLLGALVTGLPLTADGHVTGFSTLLSPYTIISGIANGLLVLVHGVTFLAWRTGRQIPGGHRLAAAAAALVAVVPVVGALQGTVVRHPASATVLVVVIACAAAGAGLALRRGRAGLAFLASTLATALPVIAVGAALFPDVLVSTVDPAGTVTVAGGAAGEAALRLLTFAAAPLLPVLVAVQAACWWYFGRPGTAFPQIGPDRARPGPRRLGPGAVHW